MTYLVQGNVQELFRAFEQQWLIGEYHDDSSMDGDLYKTRFLGNETQAKYFINTWKTRADSTYYVPGNMSAGNLFWVLGSSKPLYKPNESLRDYKDNFVHQHFAFVNEEHELCGLMLMYREDEPAQWMVGFAKNNHLPPEQRPVMIWSGFDLSPFLGATDHGLTFTTTDSSNTLWRTQVRSSLVEHLLEHVIKDKDIEPRFIRLTHLLRFIQIHVLHSVMHNIIQVETGEINAKRAYLFFQEHMKGGQNKQRGVPTDLINPDDFQFELLFAENPALDLITKYKLSLSSVMLKDCLSPNSQLREEIEKIVLCDDEQINRNILQMVILFYEEKVLNEHRSFLQKHIFIKTRGGTLWNHAQIHLIPFLLKNNYSMELFTEVLSKETYYYSILTLIQLGYTYNIPQFLVNPDKCNQLDYIHQLDNSYLKKLCLIFWAKGELHFKDYQKIVQAAKEYPMLAETLVTLDQTEGTHVNTLKELALNPQQHQQLSVLHHYAEQFDKAPFIRADLKQLNADELSGSINSLRVLKNSGVAPGDSYAMTIKNNKHGQLLRLFLPGLAKIRNEIHGQQLIKILYIGIKNGVGTLGKAIQEITDKELLYLARQFHDRFICAKQMQDLQFNDHMIALAAREEGILGHRFRKIILRVEAECKLVQEELRKSSANTDAVGKWQKIDKIYRRTLYSIAYDGLTHIGTDIKAHMHHIENQILNIVDPKVESWLFHILISIANAVILFFTLGIANDFKEKSTGNYWFFNQTRLGEQLRKLDKQVIAEIESPGPAPILSA